ncbi:ArsR/SmtB family transcription factor [Actinomarinicola tropica]|uniref:ArsR/SmtB family transcription factor n=1 Tax=Actinomarinicola tropica TaxID=2789776 RepID=UPI001E44073F|nr:helix-turn-helix domain-containing protein [Actinomarinicola tropica]
MTGDRTPAAAAQAKALASPIRLRILRLCLHDALTNQQLADRLGCDPSTAHYHARILLDAGFLERTEPRRGPNGALEKPHRSTGLSWTLDLGTEDPEPTLAMVDAVRAELADSGPGSVASSSRFVLHLDDARLDELLRRIQEILDEYTATDNARRAEDQPRLGGLLVLHRLTDADRAERT